MTWPKTWSSVRPDVVRLVRLVGLAYAGARARLGEGVGVVSVRDPRQRPLLRVLLLAPLLLMLLGASGCTDSGVPWQHYPHLFSTPTERRFVVLMCKFADVPDEPADVMDTARRFLALGGIGQGNMLDYYSDVSYGAISLAGSRVIMKWYAAPFTQTSLPAPGGRSEEVKECANAVPAEDVDFSSYYGIIIVTNKARDAGFGGRGAMKIHDQTYELSAIVFDPLSFFTDFAGHEIGHGLGMPHSWDNTPCEYCDPWDIMSAQTTFQFVGANFPSPYGSANPADGPGLNAPNLLQLGWIPTPTRVATYHLGDPETTIVLTALSHPLGPRPLAVEIVGSDPNDLYTVEYRQKDGWDAGILHNTVLIHEYKPNASPYSYLQRNGSPVPGEWLAGMTWTDPGLNVILAVKSIDAQAGTATITLGPPTLITTGPIVKIQAPANGSHVTAGVPFQLVAKATTSDGHPLPTVVWTANGIQIGTGATLTTALATPGTYTIKVTGTATNGQSASDSITLVVDPPASPPPAPTAQILSPTNGQTYPISQGGSVQLVLSSSASAGVTQYAWSDSLHLITDTKPNDTVTITQGQVGCRQVDDTISLKVTDSHGKTANATPVTITFYPVCIA